MSHKRTRLQYGWTRRADACSAHGIYSNAATRAARTAAPTGTRTRAASRRRPAHRTARPRRRRWRDRGRCRAPRRDRAWCHGRSAMNAPPDLVAGLLAVFRPLVRELVDELRGEDSADSYSSGCLPPRTSRRRFAEVCRSGRVVGARREGRDWICLREEWHQARSRKRPESRVVTRQGLHRAPRVGKEGLSPHAPLRIRSPPRVQAILRPLARPP